MLHRNSPTIYRIRPSAYAAALVSLVWQLYLLKMKVHFIAVAPGSFRPKSLCPDRNRNACTGVLVETLSELHLWQKGDSLNSSPITDNHCWEITTWHAEAFPNNSDQFKLLKLRTFLHGRMLMFWDTLSRAYASNDERCQHILKSLFDAWLVFNDQRWYCVDTGMSH